jgi:hypothetical protein
MKQAGFRTRKQIVAAKLATEIPDVIRKYSIDDFDEVKFDNDWKNWLTEISKTWQGFVCDADGNVLTR